MTQIRKVPFNAGAEWLLGAIALIRQAPLPLVVMGLIWSALSALASLTGQLWLSLLIGVFGPAMMGGIIYAMREVEQGRSAQPGYLLQGLREGKGARLLAMLLPQVGAVLVMMLLVFALFTTQELEQFAKVMQQLQTRSGAQAVPSLPAGRLLLWSALVIVAGIVAGLLTFMAVPEVMFTERGAFSAMGLSLRACLRNLGAVVAAMLLLVIAVLAMTFAANLLMLVLSIVIGTNAALLITQLLLMTVLLPLLGGMTYLAWRQMLGDGGGQPAPQTLAPGNFEA